MYRSVFLRFRNLFQNLLVKTTSTKNDITGENEKEKSSSSGMISTTGKKSFIDLIDLDGKINTKKTISNKKSNIDAGTVTIGNIPNFVDTPAEPK